MGRVNKTTEGVFVDIVGSESEVSAFDIFINIGGVKDGSKSLHKFLNEYKKSVNDMRDDLIRLSKLEEVIMQIRTKENVPEIKLSLIREYIYARCPFYRRDKRTKDIRVIVDNVENWDKNMVKLAKNAEFMQKAKEKIMKAMDVAIDENIQNYNKEYPKS